MKIAIVTDDGKTISRHFGRATHYLVVTAEDGKIIERELREKLGHQHFSSEEHGHHEHGSDHGPHAGNHDRHVSMVQAIADCQVLLCGGMGMGAYESVRQLNITPYVTDETDVDSAVQTFLQGNLIDHTELLH